MSKRKKALVTVALVACATSAALGLVVYKDQSWSESPPYVRDSADPARVLVVAYSRSGHTLAAAKEAAAYFDADLLEIEAPAYPRSVSGQRRAAADADAELTTTEIHHGPVAPERYDLVILASPTWWYRPAVPLWAFVQQTDFAGRPVYLLLTGNSRYEAEHIERFGALVAERGGRLIGHAFIERGRVYWQKTDDEVRAEVRAELRESAGLWPPE